MSSTPRNTFQATQGGVRNVAASSVPVAESESTEGKTSNVNNDDANESESKEQSSPPADIAAAAPVPKGKGRVLFIYTCPSGSPIKFRMVYSSGVRGMQQDAADKAGLEINAKVKEWTGDCAYKLTSSWRRLTFPT